MQKISLLGVIIMLLYPKSSYAIYGQGDYTIRLDGVEKNLSKATYNVNLHGRQKNLYFNSATNLELDLKDKKPDITNNQLNIYNKMYNLALFDFSLNISQLVEPEVNLFGAKFEIIKKSKDKFTKPMFFAGKSANKEIIGTKINVVYATNTSYTLFLLNKKINKKNNQICGLNFSKPVNKFSLLQGECYVDNNSKFGIYLKDLINYKKLNLQTEYSLLNDKTNFKLLTGYKTKRLNAEIEYSKADNSTFRLLSGYKTKRLNTEIEYSKANHVILWRLMNAFKTKNFNAGGSISKSERKTTSGGDTFLYNWYGEYQWAVLEKVTSSLSYNHSYSNISILNNENIADRILLNIGYLDMKSRLSLITQFGVEDARRQTLSSFQRELTFKRGFGVRYEYQGFRPWINFNLITTNDKRESAYQKESSSISYGISKNITRNLFSSYSCYQTGYTSESLKGENITNNQIQKLLNLTYRFPKLPLTFNTRLSCINNNKPTSLLSISYKKGGGKDILVKDKDDEIEYVRERPIRFGTMTENITSISKKIPTHDELLRLGRITIMVFKDKDFDEKFTEKDEPIKDIKVKLNKIEMPTNKDGKISFTEIPPGSYTFSIDLSEIPIGFACSTKIEPMIIINEGEDIYLNFPVVPTGKISGAVFIDKNRNGIWDTNEKGSADILLYANDIPIYTSLTGKYRFRNIISGMVKVKIDITSLPENFELTTKESIEVKLLPKEEIKNINFGIAEIEPDIEFE